MYIKFLRDEAGALALMLALAVVPMMVAAGIAIDYSRMRSANSELQSAADAAVLAAAKLGTDDKSALEAEVHRMLKINSAVFNEMTDPSVVVKPLGQGGVEAELTGAIRPPFMRLIGMQKLDVSVTSAAGRIAGAPVEIALALDVSTSMEGTQLADLKRAALEFVDSLFGDKDYLHNAAVSIVPYRAIVNIGTANSHWLSDSYDPANYAPGEWKGCVDARTNGEDETDNIPVGNNRFVPYIWDSGLQSTKGHTNTWPIITENADMNEGAGPNVGCLALTILPLTSRKSTLESFINNIHINNGLLDGGTFHSLGMSWAWRTISKKWQGQWFTDTSYAAPSTNDDTEKVIIFMTDGISFFAGRTRTSYGFDYDGRMGASNYSDALNAKTVTVCENIKKDKISIYTVTFMEDDANTNDMLRKCATDGIHYQTSDGSQLAKAFQVMIADRSGQLRLLY